MRFMLCGAVVCLFLVFSDFTLALELKLEGKKLVHHEMNKSTWHTPITSHGDDIYYTYVDRELRTVVAHRKSGNWQYKIIEQETGLDPYHKLPSIAVDEDGFIHVVYNMHSTPWQYKRSIRPRDISEWEFFGQLDTNFPGETAQDREFRLGPGIAAIPGNQISYPRFSSDRNGKLYLSYRECAKCAQKDFFNRVWSAGIATYDVTSRSWNRVQGKMFASHPGKLPLGVSIFFDSTNRMHVSWVYGNAYSSTLGADEFNLNPSRIAYVYSDNGGETFRSIDGAVKSLPIRYSEVDPALGHGWISPHTDGYYYGITELSATAAGDPHILVFPRTVSSHSFRGVRLHDGVMWRPVKKAPYGGTNLIGISQNNGTVTVVSGTNGIRISSARDYYDNWFTSSFYSKRAHYAIRADYAYPQVTDGMRLFALEQNGISDSVVLILTAVEQGGDIVPEWSGTTYQSVECNGR